MATQPSRGPVGTKFRVFLLGLGALGLGCKDWVLGTKAYWYANLVAPPCLKIRLLRSFNIDPGDCHSKGSLKMLELKAAMPSSSGILTS